MNLLSVLNSGKNSLKEEHFSALLGYLLSPFHEHGLGAVFLEDFVSSVGEHLNSAELARLAGQVRSCKSEIELKLEYQCSKTLGGFQFIDIVAKLPGWYLCIENKINFRSTRQGQIHDQYAGMRADLDSDRDLQGSHILSVFLVPPSIQGKKIVAPISATREVQSLRSSLSSGDLACLMTWVGAEPSVERILRKTLARVDGPNDSQSLWARLLADDLAAFFGRDATPMPSKVKVLQAPKAIAREHRQLTVADALRRSVPEDENIYVCLGSSFYVWKIICSIHRDYEAFLKLPVELSNTQFRALKKRVELPIHDFKEVVSWANSPSDCIPAYLTLDSGNVTTQSTSKLAQVARAVGDYVFVQVPGAEDGDADSRLESMTAAELWNQLLTSNGRKNTWSISYGDPGDSSYIQGTQWLAIMQQDEGRKQMLSSTSPPNLNGPPRT